MAKSNSVILPKTVFKSQFPYTHTYSKFAEFVYTRKKQTLLRTLIGFTGFNLDVSTEVKPTTRAYRPQTETPTLFANSDRTTAVILPLSCLCTTHKKYVIA